ncbi:hypothetical protein Ciccas_014207, partial [Cichlidogyrus casuarinus]
MGSVRVDCLKARLRGYQMCSAFCLAMGINWAKTFKASKKEAFQVIFFVEIVEPLKLTALLLDASTVELSWQETSNDLVADEYTLWWTATKDAEDNSLWSKTSVPANPPKYVMHNLVNADNLLFRLGSENMPGKLSAVVKAMSLVQRQPQDQFSLKCTNTNQKTSTDILVMFYQPTFAENITEFYMQSDGLREFINNKGTKRIEHMGKRAYTIPKVYSSGLRGEDSITFLVTNLTANTRYTFRLWPLFRGSTQPLNIASPASVAECRTGWA